MMFKMNRNARSRHAALTAQKRLNRRRIIRWLLISTLIIFSVGGLSLAGWLFFNWGPGGRAPSPAGGLRPAAVGPDHPPPTEKAPRGRGATKTGPPALV